MLCSLSQFFSDFPSTSFGFELRTLERFFGRPLPPNQKDQHNIHPDGNTEYHEIIERAYPNTALLSMCLMFGCFFIAYYLRGFKTGTYLPGPVSLPSLPFLFKTLKLFKKK